MKYRTFLNQVHESVIRSFESIEENTNICRTVNGNIVTQMSEIDRSLWFIYYALLDIADYKTAFEIPEDFVESCKTTKWEKVVHQYNEEMFMLGVNGEKNGR